MEPVTTKACNRGPYEGPRTPQAYDGGRRTLSTSLTSSVPCPTRGVVPGPIATMGSHPKTVLEPWIPRTILDTRVKTPPTRATLVGQIDQSGPWSNHGQYSELFWALVTSRTVIRVGQSLYPSYGKTVVGTSV